MEALIEHGLRILGLQRGDRVVAYRTAISLSEVPPMPKTSRYDSEGVRYLTARELEVIALIQHGFTSSGISARLGIDYSTVCTHVNNAMEKVGVSNRTALAVAVLLMQVGDSRIKKHRGKKLMVSYPACCATCHLRALSVLRPSPSKAA